MANACSFGPNKTEAVHNEQNLALMSSVSYCQNQFDNLFRLPSTALWHLSAFHRRERTIFAFYVKFFHSLQIQITRYIKISIE
ncbi:hypothetical protein TRIATDRAFT_298637 [Trichoderma atroviride IMI 206040]|uniref:Uncharacterized protein n=1 Tax=Hypocrea atroviridis (strain ATCC 20476 / IMI 206040) TaxID=452589 RepID=G9NNB5_HYPAI|nr:uncharacterized protein TRIATDRAFT_298637 [Trichoderma atroviride IMI 206040]EHK47564.1 hypothetical protein TRIATDRAFT_298637 [Trichoderma atroviride IMI 206040]